MMARITVTNVTASTTVTAGALSNAMFPCAVTIEPSQEWHDVDTGASSIPMKVLDRSLNWSAVVTKDTGRRSSREDYDDYVYSLNNHGLEVDQDDGNHDIDDVHCSFDDVHLFFSWPCLFSLWQRKFGSLSEAFDIESVPGHLRGCGVFLSLVMTHYDPSSSSSWLWQTRGSSVVRRLSRMLLWNIPRMMK